MFPANGLSLAELESFMKPLTTIKQRHCARPTLSALGALSLSFAFVLGAKAQPSAPELSPSPADGSTLPAPPAGNPPRPVSPEATPPGLEHSPLPPGPMNVRPPSLEAPRGLNPATPSAGPVEGRVIGYLLSPEAEVTGVLLDNDREVRVPPHLGSQLAALVKPGDRLRYSDKSRGEPGTDPQAAAWVITALQSGRTLTDAISPRAPLVAPPPAGQGQSALKAMKTSGVVKRVLTGPRGESNGVVLDNGTQVAIPPQAPDGVDRILAVGARLDAEGYGRTSIYGTALQATVLSRPGGPAIEIYAPASLR